MKNSIKFIVLSAISLIILIGVIFGILNVLDVYTQEVALENFIKSVYVVGIASIGLCLLSIIIDLFTKK